MHNTMEKRKGGMLGKGENVGESEKDKKERKIEGEWEGRRGKEGRKMKTLR